MNTATTTTAPTQTVMQCYTEFGKGNPPGVLALLHDDVLWVDPGFPYIPYAGKRQGKAEVNQFFNEMGTTVEFTRFEPQQFLEDGNFVVVKGFFAGRSLKAQKTFESEWVMIWEVTEGKIKSYQAFIDTRNVAAAME